MTQVVPITPQEAYDQVNLDIPDFVIEIINNLIVQHISPDWKGTISQDDICTRIEEHPEYKERGYPDIFNKRWLNFENLYSQFGWEVEYNKPAYNESYRPFFVFSPKK